MPSQPFNEADRKLPTIGGHNVVELLDPSVFLADRFLSAGEYPPDLGEGIVLEVFEMSREVLLAASQVNQPMSPEQVRSIRASLKLSQEDLARVLRLGPSGKRTVARWEAGDNPVPGPVSVALEALEAGWCPGDKHWREMRETYLRYLDAVERAVLQAREHVKNTGGSQRTGRVEPE